MLDVIIYVLLGAIMIEMARFGGDLAIHPPLNDKQATQYRTRFWIYALCALILTAIQGYRTYEQQEALSALLKKPTIVNVGPRTLVEPLNTLRPLRLNFDTVFMGNDNAGMLKQFARAYVIEGQHVELRQAWQPFANWIHDTDKQHAWGTGLNVGIPAWATTEAPDPQLTDHQLEAIQQGNALVFLMIEIHLKDSTGDWVKDACFFIQPPADIQSPWHQCGLYNDQRPATVPEPTPN